MRLWFLVSNRHNHRARGGDFGIKVFGNRVEVCRGFARIRAAEAVDGAVDCRRSVFVEHDESIQRKSHLVAPTLVCFRVSHSSRPEKRRIVALQQRCS